MRILLDENMPESVRVALRQLGHEADSVVSLRLQGLDNSRLYQEVVQSYELCFTKDRGFVLAVRAIANPGSVKVLRVTLAQEPRGRFTAAFLAAFQASDWSKYPNGGDWPKSE